MDTAGSLCAVKPLAKRGARHCTWALSTLLARMAVAGTHRGPSRPRRHRVSGGTSIHYLVIVLAALLTGCAATTSVVLLDPAKSFPPSTEVQILLKPPERPYVEIAKLESRGLIGEPEPSVLEDARAKAAQIGADAIIVVETSSVHQPAVILHEPWPPYLPWYRDRWRGIWYPHGLTPYPFWLEPMTLPGGNVYTVRSIAVKYR